MTHQDQTHPPAFPTWTVADGIEELAMDMRRFGLSTEDFEGPLGPAGQSRELKVAGRLDDEQRMHVAPAVVGDRP